jgi:preprotein translocase subunit YajC
MEIVSLLPLLAIVLLFWLMVVRPASRRQKDMVRLQQSLQVGQRVMLSSGIFGTIRSLTDDRARIEVASGVEVEVVRAAINTVDEPTAAQEPTVQEDGQ